MSRLPVWPTGAMKTGKKMTSICHLPPAIPSLQLFSSQGLAWFDSWHPPEVFIPQTPRIQGT